MTWYRALSNACLSSLSHYYLLCPPTELASETARLAAAAARQSAAAAPRLSAHPPATLFGSGNVDEDPYWLDETPPTLSPFLAASLSVLGCDEGGAAAGPQPPAPPSQPTPPALPDSTVAAAPGLSAATSAAHVDGDLHFDHSLFLSTTFSFIFSFIPFYFGFISFRPYSLLCSLCCFLLYSLLPDLQTHLSFLLLSLLLHFVCFHRACECTRRRVG